MTMLSLMCFLLGYGVPNMPATCLMLQESISQFVLSTFQAATKQRQYVCTVKLEILVKDLVHSTCVCCVSIMLR